MRIDLFETLNDIIVRGPLYVKKKKKKNEIYFYFFARRFLKEIFRRNHITIFPLIYYVVVERRFIKKFNVFRYTVVCRLLRF